MESVVHQDHSHGRNHGNYIHQGDNQVINKKMFCLANLGIDPDNYRFTYERRTCTRFALGRSSRVGHRGSSYLACGLHPTRQGFLCNRTRKWAFSYCANWWSELAFLVHHGPHLVFRQNGHSRYSNTY